MARMALPREFYIPTGKDNFAEVKDDQSEAVCYLYTLGNKFIAMGFSGRKAKPDFHYSYRTEADRDAKVQSHFEGQRRVAAYKAERKAVRSAPHTLNVGDILVCSWGYSMTLVDFYRVEATTPNGLTLQQIGTKAAPGGGDGYGQSGYVTADPEVTKGQPRKVRCNSDNQPKISSHSWANKWDGTPRYFNTLD